MHALRIEASGFRNLAPLDLALPPEGAVFLGPNGHGKTNLLELLYYPVLFRSVRGARDLDVVGFVESAFHLRLTVGRPPDRQHVVEAGFARDGKRKRVAIDGREQPRVTDALGTWLAVAFLPGDVAMVAGGAAERRRYLDRVLSLANRTYLRAARRYRAALDQRNAALRQGRPDVASAFDHQLATAGAEVVRHRQAWVTTFGPRWAEACAALGEPGTVRLDYRGSTELADPTAWASHLEAARMRDQAAATTTVGPHRDDLHLAMGGAPLREVGSTGQHRTAAIALKLCERETLARSTGTEPALLLDDVFAELDRSRQERLAELLEAGAARQVLVTAPRRDELPERIDLPVFGLREGRVVHPTDRAVA